MTEYFDALETRPSAQREAALLAALPLQVAHAKLATPAFAEILKEVEPSQVCSRAALATLPVTRKHELLELQLKSRSVGGNFFGGFSANSFGSMLPRVFASPGPIYEPEGTAKDIGAWRGRFLRLVFERVI
jgi:phenylacetate-CoA ligase